MGSIAKIEPVVSLHWPCTTHNVAMAGNAVHQIPVHLWWEDAIKASDKVHSRQIFTDLRRVENCAKVIPLTVEFCETLGKQVTI